MQSKKIVDFRLGALNKGKEGGAERNFESACAVIRFCIKLQLIFNLNFAVIFYPRMSFIEVSAESHFPIQNLPYGVFSTASNVRIKTDTGKLIARCEGNRLPSSSLLFKKCVQHL